MNIRDLIPKNKFDNKSITRLKTLSYNEIEPIIPALLEWLQDMNWPIANEVSRVLKPFADVMFPEFRKIFQSDDDIWKYGLLCCFGYDTNDPEFIDEMKRIARNPSKSELTEEIDIKAQELLDERNIVW